MQKNWLPLIFYMKHKKTTATSKNHFSITKIFQFYRFFSKKQKKMRNHEKDVLFGCFRQCFRDFRRFIAQLSQLFSQKCKPVEISINFQNLPTNENRSKHNFWKELLPAYFFRILAFHKEKSLKKNGKRPMYSCLLQQFSISFPLLSRQRALYILLNLS